MDDKTLQNANVSDLELLGDQLIISTYGDGLLKYNISNGTLQNYDLEINRIRSIYADENVILCSSIRGSIEITHFGVTYYTKSNGLVNESIKCIFKDREHNYWLGTDGNGLLKFLGKSVISYSTADGLGSDIVMTILQEADSNFIYGTYNAGLTILDHGITHQITRTDGLKDNTVWKIKPNPTGGNWVATSKGLNWLVDGKIKPLPEIDQITSKIRTIVSNQNTSYFGGADGIYAYNGDSLFFIQALS